MTRTLKEESRDLRSSFEVLTDRTYSNMLAMATFIANDSEMQSLFLAGGKAVEAEGGGAGGPKAAGIRRELFERIGPSWQRVQDRFDVRQLHFHLGPGSTSFLRVHRPDKFGDTMHDVRHTIVDTNAEKSPRVGFETGRVYSGLRGVVPVYATDPDSGEHVHAGALEVGTSFSNIIKILDERLGQGVGILLSMDHIESAMWPDFVKERFGEGEPGCDCAIEAQSREGLRPILAKMPELGLDFRDEDTNIVETDETIHVVTHFPLRDYKGMREPDREAVGAVVFWRDATERITAHRRAALFNIVYGIVGFLFVELLLFMAFRFATERLERIVANQTKDLEGKARQLQELSITDRLTGLFNRLKLDSAFADELERRKRYHNALSVILFDVDHFKRVNDIHGHQAGDRVLSDIATLLRTSVRQVDIPGRWGGEEFLVICPETTLEGAMVLAEKLRGAIAAHDFGEIGQVTSSFGVACHDVDESEDSLLARADRALYRAKEDGRNRVMAG
ncbi:diguanylate cyclase [Marivibrio halodurans]|uniref:diguanylate cyclase n=1 Tax=Marivibrio halodurans TaxID=2039722 RepID=A0A8J7S1Y6_9PROT|nr:diguanylate cyclase [Marivibrio halodurans]MBP5858370.1 diguanylate cyclase [Marivibrio halodurans]